MSFQDYDSNFRYFVKILFGITKGTPPRLFTKETKEKQQFFEKASFSPLPYPAAPGLPQHYSTTTGSWTKKKFVPIVKSHEFSETTKIGKSKKS